MILFWRLAVWFWSSQWRHLHSSPPGRRVRDSHEKDSRLAVSWRIRLLRAWTQLFGFREHHPALGDFRKPIALDRVACPRSESTGVYRVPSIQGCKRYRRCFLESLAGQNAACVRPRLDGMRRLRALRPQVSMAAMCGLTHGTLDADGQLTKYCELLVRRKPTRRWQTERTN